MTQLTVGTAMDKATELLVAAGMDSAKAATSAHAIVASDRWGIGSHGLMRLPFYLDRLKAGGINTKAELKKVTDMHGVVSFDGEDGLGH